MRKAIPALLIVLCIAYVAAFVAFNGHGDARQKSSLAERINAACKPGYALSDWTTGDEYTPVPAGTVKVTCVRVKSPFDLYMVAVQR